MTKNEETMTLNNNSSRAYSIFYGEVDPDTRSATKGATLRIPPEDKFTIPPDIYAKMKAHPRAMADLQKLIDNPAKRLEVVGAPVQPRPAKKSTASQSKK